MSEHEHEHGEEEEAQSKAPASSLMDEIRGKHQELAQDKTIDIPLPGPLKILVPRYRMLDVHDDLKRINTKVAHEFNNDFERALYGVIDAMLAACEGIFYDNGDGDHLIPLSESFGPGEPPVKYDERLADFLDLRVESARDTVLKVFGDKEPLILNHGRILSQWMATAQKDVMQTFMGSLG